MIGPRPTRCALAVLLLSAAGAAARDQGVPRVLIDARLNERPVTLIGLADGQITFADAGGLIRTEPLGDLVAVAPPRTDAPPALPLPAVWLVDGQRFAGAVRAIDAEPDLVLWTHPALGGLDLPMDDIARVVLRRPKRGTPAPATEAEDALTLLNGDRLAGFLDSFAQTVRFEVEGGPRDIPARRVAEVALANPPRPAAGLTVWLADGSIVRAAALGVSSSGDVSLVPEAAEAAAPPTTEAGVVAPTASLGLSDLRAIVFDAARLVPLAALDPAAQRPLADRRWTEPIERRQAETAVLGAADIVLPGPMVVEWALPRGTARFAAEAELTPDLWAWGDCELVISLVGAGNKAVELRRDRLNAERPRLAINAAITEPAARLRLTLEPGRYGSIQDRLVLRRPLLLVQPPPG